jgi:Tfp pilus assembly protein PilF
LLLAKSTREGVKRKELERTIDALREGDIGFAWTNRGVLFAKMRNRRRTIEDLGQALAIDPNNADIINLLKVLGVNPSRPKTTEMPTADS